MPDDTDNLDSIGTGEVLENLCAALEEQSLGRAGFVTRHQLLVHEDIAYTSHNSAMCCQVEAEEIGSLVTFSRAFMDTACAEGSDPGLCIVDLDRFPDRERLIRFGKAAKTRILNKQNALDEAAAFPASVYLSEHGGTGDGIIGALAGCGLRLSGFDGKIKGKMKPHTPGEVMTVEALCHTYGLDYAMDRERRPSRRRTPLSSASRESGLLGLPESGLPGPDEEGAAAWRMLGKKELTTELVD